MDFVSFFCVQGKFYRYKTPHHPHTNMAKAALNMMTRTAGLSLSLFPSLSISLPLSLSLSLALSRSPSLSLALCVCACVSDVRAGLIPAFKGRVYMHVHITNTHANIYAIAAAKYGLMLQPTNRHVHDAR